MLRALRLRLPLLALGLLVVMALPMFLLTARDADDHAVHDGPLASVEEALAPAPVSAKAILRGMASVAPAQKVQPELRAAVADGSAPERTLVTIQSLERLDLTGFSDQVRQFSWPAGEQVATAWVRSADVVRIAALPGVAKVQWSDPDFVMEASAEVPLVEPDMSLAATLPADAAELRAAFDAAPTWDETATLLAQQQTAPNSFVDGAATTDGWFDSRKGHSAAEAWEMGYKGAGVKVAVIDTSVDFGHPDLQDSWAVYPEGHMHEGWPMAFDPLGLQRMVLDETGQGPPNRVLTAEPSQPKLDIIQLSQTVTPTLGEIGGREVYTGCLGTTGRFVRPNGQQFNGPMEPTCNWIFPPSQSGKVMVGLHHDFFAGRAAGNPEYKPDPLMAEFPSVLLVDSDTAGVYDTVYVDLDVDHDFTNDKPMTKASPLGWRDVTGDGIADLSAGLLYWIADGETPYPGSWLAGYDQAPPAGKYVAIHTDNAAGGGHGTLCGSNIASRGRIGVPGNLTISYRDLPGDGKPNPMNPGMAPEAELVAVGYALASLDQSWRFALMGADPTDPSDDVQITSNSYGNSSQDDEGWNNGSRMHDYYVRTFNPSAVALFSTGNGGPGYGTIASPVPATSMNIGASTQMGSTGWDSMYETSQITYGDISPFSNRGPTAVGNVGPHVATDGAYAAGANLINTITTDASRGEAFRGGDHGNGTWGGTSRSSPIAAGLLANMYQAFKATHDRWPTWEETRSIAMAAGRYNGYDVLTMGAGVLDGGDLVRIATGSHGVHASPSEWNAGDYKGKRHEAFAKVVMPGTEATQDFTLYNHGDEPISVDLSGQRLRRVDMKEFDFQTIPISEETEYAFMAVDYLIELQRAEVPEGTDLMRVEWILPLDGVDANVTAEDPDGNQRPEAYWRAGIFQHTDWNDDQLLWDDANGNGHVDKALTDDITNILDASGGSTRRVDYENSEIQEGEYVRFSYNGNQANNQMVSVHHPLERWASGMYIGIWHHGSGRNPAIVDANFRFRISYYKYEDWDALGTGAAQVTVPAASGDAPGMATFQATLDVDADHALGAFPGAIFADYARDDADPAHEGEGGWELDHQRVVIPVIANVAGRFAWDGPITFGGDAANDADDPYNNGAVSGRQAWSWRAESGDWRFFFFDVLPPPPGWGTKFLVETKWTDESEGQADIDTQLYGPVSDQFSNPAHPANQPDEEGNQTDFSDPEFYGPHTMEQVATSPRLVSAQGNGAGRWPFNTSTGGNLDRITGEARRGLHELMLDHVLHSGKQFEMPFETTVGSIRWAPELPIIVGEECTNITLISDFTFDDVVMTAAGLTLPMTATGTVTQTVDTGNPSFDSWEYDFTLPEEAQWLEITLEGPGDGTDLDMFLMYDANGDGVFEWEGESLGDSQSPTDSEHILATTVRAAGAYQVWVHGWQVAGEAAFELTVKAVYGQDILATGLGSTLASSTPSEIRVCADDVAGLVPGSEGMLLIGPAGDARMVTIPVVWQPEGWIEAVPDIYLPALNIGRE